MPIVPLFPQPVQAELVRLAVSIRELARAYPAAAPGLSEAARLLTEAAAQGRSLDP